MIPVNIITGVLGVGKTTAVRHLLSLRPPEERWAIVVNEFDPLRDDGVRFHEICVAAGLPGCSLQELKGVTHGVGSYLPNLVPELTISQCRRLASFSRSVQ